MDAQQFADQLAVLNIIAENEKFRKEIKQLATCQQQRDELVKALIRAERKLAAYVGVCTGDKELTETVLPMARAALAKVGKGEQG